MNKKVLIIAGVVLVLAFGAYFFMSSNKSKGSVGLGDKNATENTTTGNQDEKKSLQDLLSLNVSQQCTFSDPDSKSSGRIYISNKKMRSDYSVTTDNGAINSHSLLEGDTVYLWMDGQTQGYKMAISKEDQQNTTNDTNGPQGSMDVNRKLDYKCSVWVADSLLFTKPDGITFQDLNAVLDQSKKTLEETKSTQCQACDNLPAGSAQDQCRTSLGCN